MKINMQQTVTFSKGSFTIGHKDLMGNLKEVFDLGNVYRFENGVPSLRMESWLANNSTKEYIELVTEDLGVPALKTRRGRYGGTIAHLRVLIDAAMYLDPHFKDEVIKTFMEKRILQVRDLAGDRFIELNASVALNAEELLGKPSTSQHYIELALILRDRIKPVGESWNTANSYQLSERSRIEEGLANVLRLQLVKDWKHLKELARTL